MTRRITTLLALVACATALLTPSGAAGASRATFVSGEYGVVDLGTTTCTALDEVRLRCRTTGLRFLYHGDLEGETSADLEQVIDCASGRTRGHGVETFTGSMHGGTPGTLTWRLWFTADFDCTSFFPSGLRIVAVAGSGSGGLAGIHGLLFFDDSTYRGVLG